MPAGIYLVNQVAAVLTDVPTSTLDIRNRLAGTYSVRAVRYALTTLVKTNRAQLKSRRGYYIAMQAD